MAAIKKVGFVGWRGMVGSVLVDRMVAEGDFREFEPVFFSTHAGAVGGAAPDLGDRGVRAGPVQSSRDLDALGGLDVIVSCQGGDYTNEVHPSLRKAGWKGYWIDAASALRMRDDAVIVLDPVNRAVIDRALARGVKDLIGGNCTVSLMLMVMAGPIARGMVEWISSMTYQSASGAGAKHVQELVAQMRAIGRAASEVLDDPAGTALAVDGAVARAMASAEFPTQHFGVPLAGSLIPWIDKPAEGGMSREEWKGMVEAHKIMGLTSPLPIDGVCVRVGALRCHSQALTIKLARDVSVDEFTRAVAGSNPWARVVPNTPEDTRRSLTPAAVSGSLDVAIGRIRPLKLGPGFLTAFTVGDQLLWGAAEPVRRALAIVLGRL